MATTIRAWRVTNTRLDEVAETKPSASGVLEQALEDWLESQPETIADGLMIIGRQVRTGSGPLDLLGMSGDGALVLVELKRDSAPRETVAQALDYASWIAERTEDEIHEIAAAYLGMDLSVAFESRFGEPLPQIDVAAPRIVIAATRLDEPTERMLQYLARQYEIPIDGLVFRYIEGPSGEQLLLRTSVVAEPTAGTATRAGHRMTEAELVDRAEKRGSAPLVVVLRHLNDVLYEEWAWTYGGSFRYWAEGRMLVGVNTAGHWGSPPGTIDVWIAHSSLAQVTGQTPEEIRSALKPFTFVRTLDADRQTLVRVGTSDEAESLVSLVSGWLGDRDDGSASDGP